MSNQFSLILCWLILVDNGNIFISTLVGPIALANLRRGVLLFPFKVWKANKPKYRKFSEIWVFIFTSDPVSTAWCHQLFGLWWAFPSGGTSLSLSLWIGHSLCPCPHSLPKEWRYCGDNAWDFSRCTRIIYQRSPTEERRVVRKVQCRVKLLLNLAWRRLHPWEGG